MRTRSFHVVILTLLGAALAVASAHADSGVGPTKGSGVAGGVGVGTISRTISEVVEPNGPNGPNGLQSILSNTLNVPVSPGQSHTLIMTHLRDSVNTNFFTSALGYKAVLIYSPTGQTRLKVTRPIGTFTSSDVISGPLTGYSVSPDVFTSTDAPAISPVGLLSLFGALPILYLRHRRKQNSA